MADAAKVKVAPTPEFTARFARAVAAIEGVELTREAWETLSTNGLVPLEWMTDDWRAFSYDGRRAYYPPTIETCLAMAAAVPQALAAEALGFELAQSVGAPRRRVRWAFVKPGWWPQLFAVEELDRVFAPDVLAAIDGAGRRAEVRDRLHAIAELGVRFWAIDPHEIVFELSAAPPAPP